MKIVSSFGKRIKEYREDSNLTLAEMERMTDVPAQTINRYELGQRVPKVDAAAIIADKLNLNPLWLFGYDTEEITITSSPIDFNDHEYSVIAAYKNQPETQPFVDKLLNVKPEVTKGQNKNKNENKSPDNTDNNEYPEWEPTPVILKAAQKSEEYK